MSEIIEPIQELPSTSSSHFNLPLSNLLKVITRNNDDVPYDEDRIKLAITKAFIAVEGDNAVASNRIRQQINELTQDVTQAFKRRMPNGGNILLEDIQDQVELALMRKSHHKIAVAYVLYREERRKARKATLTQNTGDSKALLITMPDGSLQPIDKARIDTIVNEACRNLNDVNAEPVIKDALRNLYNLATLADVHKALIMAARALVETEPNYTFVSARLLLDSMRSEALTKLHMKNNATFDEMTALYPPYFKAYITQGIEQGILDQKLNEYDLERLGQALLPERDMQFTYLSLQTLYDRYFIHDQGTRYELPQAFFMRVAMGKS